MFEEICNFWKILGIIFTGTFVEVLENLLGDLEK